MNTTDKGYLLGIDHDGLKVYLAKPSWDCGWYWGFGYIESYNGKGRPILYSHEHWDTLGDSRNSHTNITDKLETCALDDSKLWVLCDLMDTFYTLKKMAELSKRGYNNYTEHAKQYISFQDETLQNKINSEMLPALFAAIDKLFTNGGDK